MKQQKFTHQDRFLQLVCSLLVVLAMWNLPQPALAEISQQDVKGIINTREIAVQAINTRNFSKIEPYLHPDFTITTVDNRVFHKVPEFENYWKQQFGNSIKDIKMTVKVDNPRITLSPEILVSYGDAIATFYFKDNNSADMAMRWTAVMQKLQGRWTIQSLHFSSNLLNNPVLNGTQQAARFGAVAAGVGGLFLGIVGMLLWHRQRQSKTERAR
ncbi:MAG: YybH family protein [Microcoleus sp.]